jgi:hypothetical protein
VRSWTRLVVPLAVLSLIMAACGGGDEGRESGGTDAASSDRASRERDGGGVGAPVGQPSGQAVGAPVKMPSIVQTQGFPLSEFRPLAEKAVQEQCRGELCLRLQYVEETGGIATEDCRYTGHSDPAADTSVPRSSIVKFLFNCDDETGGEDGATEPPSDGAESGSEGPGAATEEEDSPTGPPSDGADSATQTTENP